MFLEKYFALPTIENAYIRSECYGTKSHTVQWQGYRRYAVKVEECVYQTLSTEKEKHNQSFQSFSNGTRSSSVSQTLRCISCHKQPLIQLSQSHYETLRTEFADIDNNYNDLSDDKTKISKTLWGLLLFTFHASLHNILMRYLEVYEWSTEKVYNGNQQRVWQLFSN